MGPQAFQILQERIALYQSVEGSWQLPSKHIPKRVTLARSIPSRNFPLPSRPYIEWTLFVIQAIVVIRRRRREVVRVTKSGHRSMACTSTGIKTDIKFPSCPVSS